MKRLLSILLFLIPGIALFFFMLHLLSPVFATTPAEILKPVVYFPLLLGGFMLGQLLQRIGSTLGGLCTGWSPAEFSVFGFGLHRDADNRLRLMYRSNPRLLFSFSTPPRTDGSSPLGGVYAGYAGLPAAAGCLLSLLACALRTKTGMVYVFLLGGVLLLMALLNLSSAICELREMRRVPDMRRATELNACISAGNRRGLSMFQLPDALFIPFQPGSLHLPSIFICQFNICTRLLHTGDYAHAHELLLQLIDVLPRRECRIPQKPIHAQTLIVNGAIAEMLANAAPDLSARLDDEATKLLTMDGWYERLLLARYTRALLVTQDDAAAASLLAELTAHLDALPDEKTRGNRRLLSAAQAIAAERNAHD